MKTPRFNLWDEVYFQDERVSVVALHASSTSEDYTVQYDLSTDPPAPYHYGVKARYTHVEEAQLLTPEAWKKARLAKLNAEIKALEKKG
jgi:hypothetical protein